MGTKRRPKFIKLGNFTYKIVYKHKSSTKLGETNLDAKRIDIYKHESKQTLRDTLQHEIIHILVDEIFGTLEHMKCDVEDKEEFAVRMLTPRMIQYIIDNPEFIEWLQSK